MASRRTAIMAGYARAQLGGGLQVHAPYMDLSTAVVGSHVQIVRRKNKHTVHVQSVFDSSYRPIEMSYFQWKFVAKECGDTQHMGLLES